MQMMDARWRNFTIGIEFVDPLLRLQMHSEVLFMLFGALLQVDGVLMI